MTTATAPPMISMRGVHKFFGQFILLGIGLHACTANPCGCPDVTVTSHP